MILIIHGNDLESSRNFYNLEKSNLNNPILIEGEGLTYDTLFQSAENKTFFDNQTFLVIENFFTNNKGSSAEFKKIISYINSNKNLEIIFWEHSEVSKINLTLIKNAQSKVFSFPKNLFLFLDNLKSGNSTNLIKIFHELEKNTETELIFYMLTRQFRLMLALSESSNESIEEIKRMASWQTSKLQKLAFLFDRKALLNAYNKLFDIDCGQKTGKIPYSLEKSIDFFLLDL